MQNIASFISAISMIVSLSGLACLRLFTPVFLYMLLIRYGGQVELLASGVEKLQSMTPAWMNNDLLFIAVGILAVAELAANWNSDIREFIEGSEFDKYVKVIISALICFGFLTAEEGEGFQEMQNMQLVQPAAAIPLALIGSIFCGALTAFFVKLRSGICRIIHLLDPENDLHLKTMLATAEESLALFILALAILLPFLSLVLTLIVLAFCKTVEVTMKKLEERTNHLCPECGQSISSIAEICPNCGTKQETVSDVGLLGLPNSVYIDLNSPEELRHHRHSLLMLHRCPHCASPLNRDRCVHCHKDIWADGTAQEDMLKRLDHRAIIIALVGLLVNGVPIIGFPLFIISFSVFAMTPLRAFLSPFRGCLSKIFFLFLKIFFLLLVALLSIVIPFAGLLSYVPYGLYYLHSRKLFLETTKRLDTTGSLS